jgi:CBS domain-containing protein
MNIASLLASKGPRVITLSSEHTIRQALALLTTHNIGALVVVDAAETPVGILSERDIVRALARDEGIFDQPAGNIMTRDVAVSHTMTERRIRHLPVMDAGRLVGIVSIGDVVKAQRDQYQGELDTLQLQVLKSPA